MTFLLLSYPISDVSRYVTYWDHCADHDIILHPVSVVDSLSLFPGHLGKCPRVLCFLQGGVVHKSGTRGLSARTLCSERITLRPDGETLHQRLKYRERDQVVNQTEGSHQLWVSYGKKFLRIIREE